MGDTRARGVKVRDVMPAGDTRVPDATPAGDTMAPDVTPADDTRVRDETRVVRLRLWLHRPKRRPSKLIVFSHFLLRD
jgi:hypothetical protein